MFKLLKFGQDFEKGMGSKKAHAAVGNVSELTEKELVSVTARLLRKMGYDVETNRWAVGKSGVVYDIDIYAERQSLLGLKRGYSMLVECEANSSEVTADSLRKLHFIFDDIRERIKIDKLEVVTNSSFTQDAREYAEPSGMELVDKESLIKQLMKYGLM